MKIIKIIFFILIIIFVALSISKKEIIPEDIDLFI